MEAGQAERWAPGAGQDTFCARDQIRAMGGTSAQLPGDKGDPPALQEPGPPRPAQPHPGD